MKPGDIVLVRFPHTDLQQGKLRPALVVALTPGRHADTLLALVTSRVDQAIPYFDEVVQTSDPDFALSRLKTGSVIRAGRLTTVESTVIEARLGSISLDRLTRIRGRIIAWLQS